MFNLALDPCQKWPEIYFEKYDEPNSTLIDEMYQYGRKNLALVHVMIQSPYVIKIKRDVAMTFTTYIANSGGLLGLCLGFSLMSGIEIIFCICWFCGELKKKAFLKQKRCMAIQERYYGRQRNFISSEKHNSIITIEEELDDFKMIIFSPNQKRQTW